VSEVPAAGQTSSLPLSAPLSRLAELIATHELTSRELVAACLARIGEVNPVLNAVVQLRADTALAEADTADREIAQGDVRGPLHGIPFTVKDWIDAAGLPCTGGSVEHRHRLPERDATVVARLRAAGGILLGKTNVGVQNDVFGRTNNPYDPHFSPAGSSSGEAAITAAGAHPLDLAATPAAASASLPTPAVWPASNQPRGAFHSRAISRSSARRWTHARSSARWRAMSTISRLPCPSSPAWIGKIRA